MMSWTQPEAQPPRREPGPLDGALQPGHSRVEIPLDTTLAAHGAQIAAYRRMSPERRLLRAMQMCDDARSISRAGIRSRHPEYTTEEVALALFRLVLGDDLFCAAYPGRPLVAP